MSYVKVGLVIGIVFLSIYLINLIIAKLVIPHAQNAFPFDSVDISVIRSSPGTQGIHTVSRSIDLPSKDSKLFDFLIKYLLPGSLWTIAYVRLREKEF
jgi:hypothetical protein